MKTKTYVGKYTETIQKYLFAVGFTWIGGGRDLLEKAPMLYIMWDKKTLCYGASLEVFLEEKDKELSLGELIKKIEELKSAQCQEKTKFKPFDKVLVRDSENQKWRPALFCEYDASNYDPYTCIAPATSYRHAIPYEGNEHLANKKG